MRWTNTITLIARSYPGGVTVDDHKRPIEPVETSRKVFGNKKSVTRTELYANLQKFYAPYEKGLDVTALFDVRTTDYKGEEYLEYEGKRYRIFGTFVSSNGEITELKATDASEKGRGDVI
jgi:ribosomal protein S18